MAEKKNPLQELREAKQAKKPPYRLGGLTTLEKNEVKELVDKGWTDGDIAEKLNRKESQITKYRQRFLRVGEDAPLKDLGFKDKILELRKRHEWERIKEELLPLEIPHFEHEYAKLVIQFEDDLTPSDENQLFDLIKFEILMHRNLKDRRRAMEQIETLTECIALIASKGDDKDDKDVETIQNLQNQINALSVAQKERTAEAKTFDERKTAIYKQLKFTRDQRIERLQSNKRTTWIDVIVELDNEAKMEREGKQAELMKRAVQKQKKKLGSVHQFADGEFDRPLLTPETVFFDD